VPITSVITVAVAATVIVGAGDGREQNRTTGDGGKKLESQHDEAPLITPAL
jgi:hypothetical protein